jgi:hypothetical protein
LEDRLNPIQELIGQSKLHRHDPNALIVNMSAFYGILFGDQNALGIQCIQKGSINLPMIW